MSEMRNFFGNSAGSRLFFSERDSDVAITVEWEGRKWRFPGHKLVLCTMSEVFRTMLDTDMLEKISKNITIQDSCPFAVKQFLKYLYMGVVDFNGWSQAVDLLKIAHKYSVQTLVNLSETYLVTTIVFSNACILYELSRTYSLKLLKKETQVFILEAGFIVSSTDGFFNLRPRSLEGFISSTQFNMENEGNVLTSLREWAVCECSRKCIALSSTNVLAAMEPFLKFIRWNFLPGNHRTFVPCLMIDKYKDNALNMRRPFFVPPVLQYHMNYVKLVVELGAFHDQSIPTEGSLHCLNLNCLKFSVDNHLFLSGFRIVGLFSNSTTFLTGPSCLTLSREDNKLFIQFNLNSLSWTKGSSVGKQIWHEMIAYLPYPIRVDPFSIYLMNIKSRRSKELERARWPRTRLESETVSTDLGMINFRAYGPCYGITQLFVLPAPPYRNVCNAEFD